MTHKNVLIVTDNDHLCNRFKEVVSQKQIPDVNFQYCCTSPVIERTKNLNRINVKKEYQKIIENFDLVISIHCKQIFPAELVQNVKCINVHPGLNPYNRGWYPQVFSIMNKLPIGATIHEMDAEIDHGKIIDQKAVPINSWDTSLDVYNKVLDVELELIEKNLEHILGASYAAAEPASEGNYNSIDDFNSLLKLDLEEVGKFSDFLDKLRALTHGTFDNAYYEDPATGQKIYVKIKLEAK